MKQAFQNKQCDAPCPVGNEIPEGWGELSLGDIANFKNGKSSPERNDVSNYAVFGSNGIIGHVGQYNSPDGTVIVGRVGSYCGSVYFSRNKCWVTDNAIIGLPSTYTDAEFLYYLLLNLNLNNHRGGSGHPLLNQGTLNSLKVSVPSFNEQRAIAKILSDLDEKIELNHQMNKTLEVVGQALFKRWFVDFEFPGYEKTKFVSGFPVGWEEKPLDQVAHFLNGLALQKYPQKGEKYLPAIKIRELNQGVTESSDKVSIEIDPAYIVDDGDVLFSWSGSLNVVLWGHGKGALNQHLFKVTSQEYPKWLSYFWIKEHLPDFRLIAEGKATTMGHIQRHHLSQAMVLVPKKEI